MPKRNIKKIIIRTLNILIVLMAIFLSTSCTYIFDAKKAISTICTSTYWSPQTTTNYKDKVVVIDMGANNTWPQLWKSVGSFIEENALVNVIIVPFREVTLLKITEYNPKAAVLTGYFQPLVSYKTEEMQGLFDFLKKTDIPIFGICGGLQFIGKAFGSQIIPLGTKEKGFVDVKIVADDPIFTSLSSQIKVFSWHEHQLDPLPDGFILLGTNDTSRIQMLRHKDKVIYGVQFHPEYSSPEHKDGFNLWLNFMTITNIPRKQ